MYLHSVQNSWVYEPCSHGAQNKTLFIEFYYLVLNLILLFKIVGKVEEEDLKECTSAEALIRGLNHRLQKSLEYSATPLHGEAMSSGLQAKRESKWVKRVRELVFGNLRTKLT